MLWKQTESLQWWNWQQVMCLGAEKGRKHLRNIFIEYKKARLLVPKTEDFGYMETFSTLGKAVLF